MLESMSRLIEILSQRQLPGVIILDGAGTLVFMNEAVRSIVPILPGKAGTGAPTVPEEIRSICLRAGVFSGEASAAVASLFYTAEGKPYALRAFPLGGAAEQGRAQHTMVLVEPIVERHQVDFAAVQSKYGISKRELEVLKLICQGLSNREIAGRLFISEHTAKDHVCRILRAFKAASRNEVMAALNH
jgi:ATP/maltotriose-dependent transcriptional regulator MalT